MELATLKINVDATGAKRAVEDFGQSVDGVTKKAKGAQAATDGLSSSFKTFASTAAAYGAVRYAQALGEMADQAKLVSARLALVTTNARELANVQRRLFESAQRTGAAYADVATLYTRVARNAQTLGKSQADLLKFTELVNMSIISSGATSSEASAGVLQLSQALAKGRLDGDEFRSVMENMPQVADALTASLNITKGELYSLAREGKITGKTIVDAMLGMEQQTRQAFESMPLTIARAIQMAKNDILRFIGEVDSATGASGFFAEMIRNAPGAAGRVLGGTTLGTLARAVGGFFPRTAGATSSGESAMVGTGTLAGMPFLGSGTRAASEERQAWEEAQAKAARRAAWEEEAITRALRLANARFMAENPTGPVAPGAGASIGLQGKTGGRFRADGVNTLPVGMRTSTFADSAQGRMKAAAQEMAAGVGQMAEASKMITENFLRGLQGTFSGFFRQLFTEGVSSFKGLMDSFKNLVLNTVAELASKRLMDSIFGGAGGAGGLLGKLSGGALLGIGVGAFALSKMFTGQKGPSYRANPTPTYDANGTDPRQVAAREALAKNQGASAAQVRSAVGSALEEGTAVRLFATFEAMRQSLANIESLLRSGAMTGGGTSASGLDRVLGTRSQSLRLAAGVAVVG